VAYALEVRGVSLRFGGVRALTEVSFGVNDGELFSIIGPNGAGKTSIVNCISGRYRPTEGQLFYRGQDITALNPNARPRLGIGRDVVLDRVIVDKNARIGDGAHLVNEASVQRADGDGYYIRDGVIIVPKDGVIRPGTRV